MATSGWSNVSQKNTNFARLCKLLIDGGSQVLRDTFNAVHPPHLLHNHLIDPTNYAILNNLRSKRVLRAEQWAKLYPSIGSVSSTNFDITLLCVLLRNICHLPTPTNGWDKEPLSTSINIQDDVVRIKLYRNHLYGHISEPAFSDAEFIKHWNDIETVLVRLGGPSYKSSIDNLKIQSLDPEVEECYIQCLKEWSENEERVLKALDGTEERVMSKVVELHHERKQDAEGIKQKLDQVLSMKTISPCESTGTCTLEDVELYSKKLKTATEQQTQMQPEGGSPLFEEVTTDQIFANLTIHDGPPKSQKPSDARADFLAKTAETRKQIQSSAEIFLSDQPNKNNPKTILIDGKAGIGKTLFSHKLARDWAKDCIFDQDESSRNPDIKFAYRITFRQLNLLDEEKALSLMELLNLSSTLDGTAMVGNTVLDHIIEHPDQLMVVFDGYDEYKHRNKITSCFHSQYADDPRQKMHVAAIVSKLARKKFLRNSVIVFTSRTSEAIQMAQSIHCDRYLEISGFSKPQFDNYVEKYFEVKQEEIKTKALNKVKSSPHYISFGAVPLLAFLLCVVVEWEVKNSRDYSVSQTLTEFYYHVLYIIERHYNRRISSLDGEAARSAVERNLDNFSRLCARLIEQNRFSFTIKDLKNLKIPEEEILYLTSSSLLSCTPILSNSPVPEITSQEYSFHHFSFQEFLAARHFVSINEIPAEMTEMIFQFMSGLMDPETNEQLMVDLLYRAGEQLRGVGRDTLVSLRCLFEYKNKDFVTRVLMANHHQRYWDSDGGIGLPNITDIDCRCIAMLVDTLSAVRLTSPPYWLDIVGSSFTSCGLDVLLRALTNNNCTITGLGLNGCKLDDDCVKMVACSLPHSNITKLSMYGNNIADDGVTTLVNYCSKLTDLNLSFNPLISNECIVRTRQFCQSKYPGLWLFIDR